MTVESPNKGLDEGRIALEYEEFHRLIRNTRSRLLVIMTLSIVACILTLFLTSYVQSPPKLVNIVTDRAGQFERVTPTINPKMTDKQAIRWSNDAASELLSLHFKKYPDQLEYRKRLFVEGGWELYQRSLFADGIINKITDNGLIITAVNKDTPRLLRKLTVRGKQNWYVEIKMLQTVVGASDGDNTKEMLIGITVEETRRDDALDGLAIRLFEFKK